MSTALAFTISVLLAALLTPQVRNLALRLQLVDTIDSRKVHRGRIPRLGGIAIVAATYATLLFVFAWQHRWPSGQSLDARGWVGLLGGGLVIAGLGVYDDLFGAGAKTKFVLQFVVAGALYWLGFRVELLTTPFNGSVALGALSLPFTLLWIVGVTNAINLIDGLDGLAGGVAVIALGSTFIFSIVHGQTFLALASVTVAGAVLGFLFYNFHPATIFMGDTGSLFLGFILATLSIKTSQKSSTAVSILVPLIVLGLPIGDTVLSIARRVLRGRPIFSADQEHIHHRLLARGLNQRQSVLFLYAICVGLGVAAQLIRIADRVQAAALLTVMGLLGYLLLTNLGYLGIDAIKSHLGIRRDNLLLRRALDEARGRLRAAKLQTHLWDAVRTFAQAAEVSDVRLRLGSDDAQAFAWSRVPGVRRVGGRTISLADAVAPALHVTWAHRAPLDRDRELAVENLWKDLLRAHHRVARENQRMLAWSAATDRLRRRRVGRAAQRSLSESEG
jgi:UDP-GlcNAc:undecaprenyl-phosphate GlcNAc-1-phosphate transferase